MLPSSYCFKAASYAVYLAYYLANDTFPDGDAFDYAMIGGLEFAIALLLAPLVTIVARTLGTRWTMAIGAVVHACGFVAASFASNIVGLYWTQGVMVGVGISFLVRTASTMRKLERPAYDVHQSSYHR
jgi:hypothetical protein